MSNAVKFTPGGGTIWVQAGVVDATVDATVADAADVPCCRIIVRDNGPGIPPADQERIFEPFQRGQAQQRFPQGMGLGLTIARDHRPGARRRHPLG